MHGLAAFCVCLQPASGILLPRMCVACPAALNSMETGGANPVVLWPGKLGGHSAAAMQTTAREGEGVPKLPRSYTGWPVTEASLMREPLSNVECPAHSGLAHAGDNEDSYYEHSIPGCGRNNTKDIDSGSVFTSTGVKL